MGSLVNQSASQPVVLVVVVLDLPLQGVRHDHWLDLIYDCAKQKAVRALKRQNRKSYHFVVVTWTRSRLVLQRRPILQILSILCGGGGVGSCCPNSNTFTTIVYSCVSDRAQRERVVAVTVAVVITRTGRSISFLAAPNYPAPATRTATHRIDSWTDCSVFRLFFVTV